jgi:FkbM family methyltransferase
MSPWIVLDSVHGKFIVNRHCAYVAEWIVKTGATHIEAEIAALVGIANTLPEKCIVVDAGASHGLISVSLANAVKAKGGTVYAYEPQTPFHWALCGTMLLNGIDNLIPVCCGLSDNSGMMNLPDLDYNKPQDFGLASLKSCSDARDQVIDVYPLDTQGFSRLDILKIDVEGMEFQVLTGARRSLVEFRPWCWVEYNMSDVDALKSCFDGLDYTFFRFDQQNMLCAPRKRLVESGIKVEAETM